MNLILNARDAMPTGGRIRVETSNSEISAADALESGIQAGPVGPSVRHRYRPRHRFRCHGTYLRTVLHHQGKRQRHGLGIEHGLQHREGMRRSYLGAQFARLRRHVHRGFPEAPARPWKRGRPSPSRNRTSGSETILLVEDEEASANCCPTSCAKRGYTVLEAANGDEALRIFQASGAEIHLVLTDMVMPGMSGRETADRLRQDPPRGEGDVHVRLHRRGVDSHRRPWPGNAGFAETTAPRSPGRPRPRIAGCPPDSSPDRLTPIRPQSLVEAPRIPRTVF